jgi:hypothetical protein
MGIGERVRDAHLSHFCPGGAGFPVASPNSAGVDLDQAAFLRLPRPGPDIYSARATGEVCGRCEHPIEAGEAVRRRARGPWVHENCPPPAARRG